MTTNEIAVYQAPVFEQLEQPLPEHVIKHRPGPGGRQLRYISGKTAIDTANRVFGFGRWGYKVVSRSHELMQDEKKGTVIEFYTADIELSVVGCAFPFPGDGMGIVNSPTVESHEKARKEATTDALKRALRHFGDQFGLCLYDEDAYVEGPDGELKHVKDVKPTNGRAPQRVVDSPQSHQNGQQSVHSSAQQNGTTKPSQPATVSVQDELAVIPNVTQLRADVALLQIKNGDGSLMAWKDVLAHVFKKALAEQKVTIEALVEQELGPDACKRIQQFLDAVRQARKSKVASGK